MAGSNDTAGDNPVAINFVAMVDIIFCLCVFFFSSFHFRQLEGKMESWLPDRGPRVSDVPPIWIDDEIRVVLRSDPVSGAVRRQVYSAPADGDPQMRAALRDSRGRFVRAGIADPRVAVQADGMVPWGAVVKVLDLCRQEGLERIEFSERNQGNG